MKAKLKKYKIGDPRKKENKIGLMARIYLRDEVHEQVTRSVAAGAKLVLDAFYPAPYYP